VKIAVAQSSSHRFRAPDRGGELYAEIARRLSKWKDSDIEVPLACVRFLISDAAATLTGKTISAGFDPWDEPEFGACLSEIVSSSLYTTQRINLAHLKGQPFIEKLVEASEKRKRRPRGTNNRAKPR
jgi:hypothetical protein